MKFSNDNRVSFDYKTHSYFLGDKRLESVTTILSKYKNKFDSDYWSEYIAKKENTTKEEILKKWDYEARKSCEIGTAIHKIFEDYVDGKYSFINGEFSIKLSEVNPEYYIDFFNKSIIAIRFIKDFFLSGRLKPLFAEFIVYNCNIAGQVDLICEDKKGDYYILDFKTNKKIDYNSYRETMMLDELFEFEDCNFIHYSLQLSIYKKLLKQIKIKDLYLVHITSENYELIKCHDLSENKNLKKIVL